MFTEWPPDTSGRSGWCSRPRGCSGSAPPTRQPCQHSMYYCQTQYSQYSQYSQYCAIWLIIDYLSHVSVLISRYWPADRVFHLLPRTEGGSELHCLLFVGLVSQHLEKLQKVILNILCFLYTAGPLVSLINHWTTGQNLSKTNKPHLRPRRDFPS